MKKNDTFETDIVDLTENGEGIGHAGDGMTFFIRGALPGDRVSCAVTKLKKTYGYARLLSVLTPSPDRVTPRCPVAGTCGGCSLQALSYDAQCRFKAAAVRNDLIRIGGFSEALVDSVLRPIIRQHSAFPQNFRNKAQFPVGTNADGQPVFGFYAPHSHRIVENTSATVWQSVNRAAENGRLQKTAEGQPDIPVCLLGPDCSDAVLHAVRDWRVKEHISIYDEETGRGLLRHVVIRKGRTSGEIMVCLVINGKTLPGAEALTSALFALPGMTSFSVNINTSRGNAILGRETVTLRGKAVITDTIGNLTFSISPNSFFQVNPEQTEKLYAKALECAGLTGSETVWDLYCGTGTISLFLAQHALRVYGVEIIPQAIENAKKNALENGIENAAFYCGKSEDIAPTLPAPDVIVVDPPRKGCDPALLETILRAAPRRVVYVSCNPATLARDLAVLCGANYSLKEVTPVEQFAHSIHVEAVALLERQQ